MEKQRKIYVTPITRHITQHTETHLLAGTWIEPTWTGGTHEGEFDSKQTELSPDFDNNWNFDHHNYDWQ